MSEIMQMQKLGVSLDGVPPPVQLYTLTCTVEASFGLHNRDTMELCMMSDADVDYRFNMSCNTGTFAGNLNHSKIHSYLTIE